jgi:hypothetical protein
LIYLILTLNQCYPDYDFSLLRARHFRKEDTTQDVEPLVDSHLLQVSKVLFHLPGFAISMPLAVQVHIFVTCMVHINILDSVVSSLPSVKSESVKALPSDQILFDRCALVCRCGNKLQDMERNHSWTPCGAR